MKKITKISTFLLTLTIPLFILDFINNFSTFFCIIPLLFFLFIFTLDILYTNKFPKNKLEEFYLKAFFNNFEHDKNCIFIKFEQSEEVYKTINGKKNITLDLTGYPFQINYLKAFIIRQIRYIEIHNKLSLLYIFKRKFKSEKFDEILIKLIINNNKKEIKKEFYVVKNGYYISSYIINTINMIKYAKYLWFKKEGYNQLSKKKSLINEDIYQKGWIR